MTSLRATLTLWVAAVLVPIVAALTILTYVVVEQRMWRQVDEALVGTATAFASVIEYDPAEPSGYEFEFDPSLAPEFADTSRAGYFEIWLPDGTVRAKSRSLAERDLPRLSGTLRDPGLADLDLPGGRPGRIVYYEFQPRLDSDFPNADPGTVALAVARDTSDVSHTLSILAGWLWGLGLLAVSLVVGAAWWSVRRGLQPLDRLAGEIEAIDDVRSRHRIRAEGYPDELRVPVTKLNDLLERLGAAFARERQMTADLSHELRTPLAALRSVLEVTNSRKRTPAEYREAFVQAHAIVKGMIGTSENLLMIAKADAGQIENTSDSVDLHELVRECWAAHAQPARSRSLRFCNELEPGHRIVTDREKLRIVVSNLLQNAVSYTERGGWIRVAAPDGAMLEVSDSGPPIPTDELDRIFDRFWRADTARTGAGTHAGIGLALVRSLCSCLGLSITATNTTDAGPCFSIRSR